MSDVQSAVLLRFADSKAKIFKPAKNGDWVDYDWDEHGVVTLWYIHKGEGTKVRLGRHQSVQAADHVDPNAPEWRDLRDGDTVTLDH